MRFRGLPDALVLRGVARLPVWELFAVQKAWRRRFAAAVQADAGVWTYRGYDWHAFSYGYTPCEQGSAALEAVQQHLGSRVFIIADAGNSEMVGGRGVMEACGTSCVARNDWSVVAADVSWSLTFTHEPGFGPYYAESTDAETLQLG